MVTIKEYQKRENAEGKSFHVLIVESGLEVIQSQTTGKNYFSKIRASVPSTFSEEECENLIGESIPGSVKKVDCEPYEVTNKETGEVFKMTYRYEYFQEGEEPENIVPANEVEQPLKNEKAESALKQTA